MKHLILGIGNLLLGDEGVGVHAARALQAGPLPEGTAAVDAGTAILDMIPHISEAEHIIVIDAMQGQGAPGTVYRVPLADCRAPQCIASLHGFSLAQVLFLCEREQSPRVTVLGVEPQSMAWSVELSPPVAQALPAVVEEALRLVAA